MGSSGDVQTVVQWVESGDQALDRELSARDSTWLREPSSLPGWTRGHIVTHLARNADAVTNLLTWAQTGVETPMYATPGQREEDIERGAGRDLSDQLTDLRDASARFLRSARSLREDEWSAMVVSGLGRDIPAREAPWLRAREVWIHRVDLFGAPALDDMPSAFVERLIAECARFMSGKTGHGLRILADGTAPVTVPGDADQAPIEVRGRAGDIAGWLTGRADGSSLDFGGTGALTLPRWI